MSMRWFWQRKPVEIEEYDEEWVFSPEYQQELAEMKADIASVKASVTEIKLIVQRVDRRNYKRNDHDSVEAPANNQFSFLRDIRR